jgi:hypothetical protein
VHLKFLDLPPDERRLYVEQAAVRRNVSPVMLEKDFWVCWVLAVLFESTFAEALVFKGGTSLSKVFGVINRFSEDIDLSVAPDVLGMSEGDPASRAQADRWMTDAEARCAETVRDRVRPEMERAAALALGEPADDWFEFTLDGATRSPVLLFRYPTTQPAGFAYLTRSVKLEFGSLTDQRPKDRHPVRPWIAEVFAEPFSDWSCHVVALDVHRTFWEKATILHAEYHRPPDRSMPDRFSRHYADTVSLAHHPIASRAVERADVRDRVVAWKSRFFGSAWARYDLARPGSFRLVPAAGRTAGLRRDYDAMRDMYVDPPAPFEDILGSLGELERRINAWP